jgi:hypothetical protein
VDICDKLRSFAEYLDERPKLKARLAAETPNFYISLWCDDDDKRQAASVKAEFAELCREMGSLTKAGHNGVVSASHVAKDETDPHGWSRKYRVDVSLSGACKRREKLDDEGLPVMKKRSKYVETNEWEPEYEWDCPQSFLNL